MENGFMENRKKTKKSKIKVIIKNLLDSSFFSEWRTTSDVIKRLTQKGFTIEGKKVGMVARMLTQMCQDPTTGLEREEVPKKKREKKERWAFKKTESKK